MRNRRLVLRTIAETVSLGRTFSRPRPGLRILMYHSIGARALGDAEGIFSISPERFRSHAGLLADLKNCKAVPLEPLGLSRNESQVAVTFDDGYLDNLRIAAPILAEFQLPFSVFVSSDFIRRREKGFMSPEELKEMARLPGAIIGAHGKSHCRLTACNDAELETELDESKRYLEDLLGQAVTSLAYPFGAVDMRVRDEAQRLGYSLGVCTRFDVNLPERDLLLLCRYSIERDDTSRVLFQKLQGNWDWYRWRSPDPFREKP